jgi:hypothetical protein
MKTFNKLAIASALLAGSGVASAFPIGDILGDNIEIKYSNFEVINPDTDANTGSTNASGLYLGDNFGIAKVATIQDQDSNTLWFDGKGGEEVTIVFWGFDVFRFNAVDLDATGGYLAAFVNDAGDWDISNGPADMIGSTSVTIDGFNLPQYTGITDGDLMFVGEYDTGIISSDPTTLAGIVDSTNPLTGKASGYLNIVENVGDFWENFDTDGFDITDENGNADTRDLFANSDFDPVDSGSTAENAGWTFESEDPVEANVVPVPATLALLGLGLVGMGFKSRRRKV